MLKRFLVCIATFALICVSNAATENTGGMGGEGILDSIPDVRKVHVDRITHGPVTRPLLLAAMNGQYPGFTCFFDAVRTLKDRYPQAIDFGKTDLLIYPDPCPPFDAGTPQANPPYLCLAFNRRYSILPIHAGQTTPETIIEWAEEILGVPYIRIAEDMSQARHEDPSLLDRLPRPIRVLHSATVEPVRNWANKHYRSWYDNDGKTSKNRTLFPILFFAFTLCFFVIVTSAVFIKLRSARAAQRNEPAVPVPQPSAGVNAAAKAEEAVTAVSDTVVTTSTPAKKGPMNKKGPATPGSTKGQSGVSFSSDTKGAGITTSPQESKAPTVNPSSVPGSGKRRNKILHRH